MNIRPMTPADRQTVLPMAQALYNSPAAEAPLSPATLSRVFEDAVGPNPLVQGFLLEQAGTAAGYAYLTFTYSCEAAGTAVEIEELYLRDEARGLGLGQQFFDWLYAAYPQAARFRLDVTFGNRAAHLYQRNGFRCPEYGSMIFDR